MTTSSPSIPTLQRALAIAEQIQKLESELAGIMGTSSPAPTVSKASGPGGRRTFSPETKAKMAAAQQARWAKKKGQSTPAVKPARSKRTVSAETRAKMVTAAKARYAKKDTSPPATSKPEKKKRVLSPEGRARIVAALKARHAAKTAK